MTYQEILRRLIEAGALSPAEADPLAVYEARKPFSLHGELRTMLYFGVTLLSTGLGILIYENLDTLGHQAVIAIIALLMGGCFAFVVRKAQPYTNALVENGTLTDFSLLLGCLLFLTLEGYLQAVYHVFGERYGLVTILPAGLFLVLAYRFDHRGVLSMGLTALASWVGLTVAPLQVLSGNDFNQPQLLITALIFGFLVMAAALALQYRGIKRHFTGTYLTLAGNLSFVAALAGWFRDEAPVLYLVILAALCVGFGWYARQHRSFFFLLMALVYGYVGFSSMLFRFLPEEVWGVLIFYYFVISCGGIVWFLFRYKQLLGIQKQPAPAGPNVPSSALDSNEKSL